MTAYEAAMNKVAKWRTVLAGWQLGTRTSEDPESRAVRDHREATIIHRVELSALTALLIKNGVFTASDFEEQCVLEAKILDLQYEQKFPGITTSLAGVHMDPQKINEAGTMKGWRP